MALLQRIFHRKKNNRSPFLSRSNGDQSVQKDFCKFDKEKIRLVIYKEDRGRTPLYDSTCIKLIEDVSPVPPRRISSNKTYFNHGHKVSKDPSLIQKPHSEQKWKYQKLGSDVKVIEEMMFGSVAMAYKGSLFKVHHIRTPSQLMLTKVYIPEKPKRESGCELDYDSSSLPSNTSDFSAPKHISSSHKSTTSIAQSMPVDVPSTNDIYGSSLDTLDEDSGLASFTSSGSLSAPFPSPSNNSGSSYNSLHRRWMRTQTTSLGRKSTEYKMLDKNLHVTKKSKVGIAVLIETPDEKDEEAHRLFQEFFFSHITLFESHINKLQSVVTKAYFDARNFVPLVMEALEVLRNSIYDLYMAPRLSEPVWLNMMSYSTNRYALCKDFMNDFMSLAAKYDNKNTKFFVSTLISAVLTHHLAWVPTVTPAGGTLSSTYEEKHSAKWLNDLAKVHPYNPLWAQLGDLYGAIGNPLKVARTIVVGKNTDLVKKFLVILSYFIRCSDIHECVDSNSLKSFISDIKYDSPPTPSGGSGILTPAEDSNSNCSSSLVSTSHRLLTSTPSLDLSSLENVTNEVDMFEVKDKNNQSVIDNLSDPYKENLPASDLNSCDSGLQCSVSALKVNENSRIENVQLVNRSVSREVSIEDINLISSSNKLKSKLSQQLESEKTLSKKEIKKLFLKEGSNSMFEEYFDAGIETKTIDEVAEGDRVIQLPLVSPSCAELDSINFKKDKKVVSRHNSVDRSKLSRPTSLVPGRCRSVTPTELSRRRHLSSAGSVEFDPFDPVVDCKEIPLPGQDVELTSRSVHGLERNFGRSLLGGISDHYLSDFVLHGTKDTNLYSKLLHDLQLDVQQSVIDEEISETVCIIADVDNWNVEIASSNLIEKYPTGSTPCVASQIVCNLVESVLDLWKLKMSPEFCMMHLEDRLQEIYFKSLMVAEYRVGVERTNVKDLTTTLGFDLSDYHLLMAVAATHSPHLILQPTTL
ncbi:hypothetical protein LOTGIDRAFT_236112 [Lottia gigantea]|uniref:UDENN FNIP1/2-type domain-containing protein n=1 Tax=Lottia gigantea TaxID=225164 RepID=V3ZKF1_LOTGI|nr:hypothetical protein LOTGIDRAFT_236112 [Lottia gigantea]ESO84757.1 hypothetical protein LOTGIDRAFT_236112 [Lottia gigantea]